MPGARTRVFALLGDPVAHSLSPAMHNAAFRALGLDAVYVALPCAAADLGTLMRALAAAGGGGNVTIPHKQAAAAVACGPGSERYSAANTFWAQKGRLVVGDTDTAGITAAWRALGEPPGPWLLIGTGGSAIAAARAGRQAGAAITVRSRSEDRRARFEAMLRDLGQTGPAGAPPALVVNCTPLGLDPADPLPLAVEGFPAGAAALDLVYRPGSTAWVRALVARGVRAADGREVLLAQGAEAFARWFPDFDPPTEVMRARLRVALGPPVG